MTTFCCTLFCKVIKILFCPCCEDPKAKQRVEQSTTEDAQKRIALFQQEAQVHELEVHEHTCLNDYRYEIEPHHGNCFKIKCKSVRCQFKMTVTQKAFATWADKIFPPELGDYVKLQIQQALKESTKSGKVDNLESV